MLTLRRLPDGVELRLPRDADSITLGRAAPADVILEDPHVSALHARISRRGEEIVFQDLHSTNGSALERAGRRSPMDPAVGVALRRGDRLLLGAEPTPLILEVLALERAGSAAREATLVASTRLAGPAELSERLQAAGRALGPYLELADALGRAGDEAEALRTLGAFGRAHLGRTAAGAWSREPGQAPEPLWGPTGAIPALTFRPPPHDPAALHLVRLPDEARALAVLPLCVAAGREPWLLVAFERAEPAPADLDGALLAASLLTRRLAELDARESLERARARLDAQNRYLRERFEARRDQEMIGRGAAMQKLRHDIQAVAVTEATVLIQGPSGSGKELVAREIHRRSLRHAGLFAALNCGALAEGLLESELFGHRKGAFTGAHRDRAGLFEVAHGGSLLLDEIGEMSPALQVKLLRVLETREVLPVGGTRPRRVDVRVISATHRDLEAEVRAGRFREDLFYRLHVFPIRVPGLDERREDIPDLVRHLLGKLADQEGRPVPEVSPEALRALCTRSFPGNVRQLANEVQRALIAASGEARIEPRHLAWTEEDGLARAVRAAGQGALREQLTRVERVLVEEALQRCQGNRTHAARSLGITRQALLQKLERLGLVSAPRAPAPDTGEEA